MENQQNTSTKITRITTLADHRRLLTHVFETARERVIVVSPFISSSAIKADGVDSLIRSTTRRGVSVSVYTDSQLNMTEQGEIKESAGKGIRMIANSGGKVYIVNGIHHKTLIRDDDLITEGSFNWLSAVRSKGAVHQREERTMVIEGEEAKQMSEIENSLLNNKNYHLNKVGLNGSVPAKRQKTKDLIKICAVVIIVGSIGTWFNGLKAGLLLSITIGIFTLPAIIQILSNSRKKNIPLKEDVFLDPLYKEFPCNVWHQD